MSDVYGRRPMLVVLDNEVKLDPQSKRHRRLIKELYVVEIASCNFQLIDLYLSHCKLRYSFSNVSNSCSLSLTSGCRRRQWDA